MKRFGMYYQMQCKRVFKSFFSIMLMTLLLAGGMGAVAWLQVHMQQNDESKQKISLGIVGDAYDSYLGIGIYALENLDSSRFTLNFVFFEDEAEAEKGLTDGTVSGYIRIPEGFVDSIVTGENQKVTYVYGGGQAGIGSQLIQELSETISELITESQTGIYSMMDFYRDQGEKDHFYEDMNRLNLQYFDVILAREKMYQLHTVEGRSDLSAAGYYLGAILLLFFLLWGMNGGPLLVSKDTALNKVMASRGMGSISQVLGEFAAYFVLMAANAVVILGVLSAGVRITGISFEEIRSAGDMVRLGFYSLPVVLCFASLHYLLYSFVDSLTAGLLMNFLVSVGLGYISGYFYPLSYFPDFVQRISHFLVTGVSMDYMHQVLQRDRVGMELAGLLLYTILFLAVAVLVKRHRLKQ